MSNPVVTTQSTSDALLDVRSLGISAGGTILVSDVELQLRRGERVGLIGASGSGKSLTCMAIAGLLPEGLTVSGEVLLAGEPGNLLQAKERALARIRGARTGMVFQEPMTALNPTMRVGRQVAEAMRQHGVGKAEAHRRTQELLVAVDLPDPEVIARAYPHQLSGGQRQRVVLSIALANGPDLLICDEPTTALDVTVQAKVLELIGSRLEVSGAALLFVSHDLAVVASICDRVAVMYRGRIVEQGSVLEVLADPQHEHTRQLIRDADLGGGRR